MTTDIGGLPLGVGVFVVVVGMGWWLSRVPSPIVQRLSADASTNGPLASSAVQIAAVGWLVGVLAVGLVPASVIAGVSTIVGRRQRALSERRRRDAELVELAELLELVGLGVRSGRPVAVAVSEACRRLVGSVDAAGAVGQLCVALQTTQAPLTALERWVDDGAVSGSDDRAGVGRLLLTSIRTGGVVGERIDRRSARLHQRVAHARLARARQLPVRMLPPLVVCILPAFIGLTVVPLLVVSLQSMAPLDLAV